MATEILNETDVTLKIIRESDDQINEQRIKDAWAKVYGARQNNTILKSQLSGIERVKDRVYGVVMIDYLVKGIIPLEHSGCENIREFNSLIGQDVYFKVTMLDREGEQFAASIKDAVDHLQGLTWDMLRKGIKIEAKITGVFMKYLRLDCGAIPVKLPVEEMSYEWIDDLRDIYKVGDTIQVRVTELDKEEKKLIVSRKVLLPNPWPDCMKRYTLGGIYPGTVSGKEEYGTFVNLEPGVDCLTTQPHPNVGSVKKGDKVFIKINRIRVNAQKINGRIVRRI